MRSRVVWFLYFLSLTARLSAARVTRPGTRNTETDAGSTHYHSDIGVLKYVNPFIGTEGTKVTLDKEYGGMIPSVSVPFGMTMWTAQTRENDKRGRGAYYKTDDKIHGFQATHQPAIWMGEMGQVVLAPGIGEVKPSFENRGLAFDKGKERSTPYVYEVLLNVDTKGNGVSKPKDKRDDVASINVAMTATSHVGRLSLDFKNNNGAQPYVFIQATRADWEGSITIDPKKWEIYGSNPERQDSDLGPDKAAKFNGYFVSRFSEQFESTGITLGKDVQKDATHHHTGKNLGAYVKFSKDSKNIEVRTAVSFVSVEQARKNLDLEAPDGSKFGDAVETVKKAWLEKLGRVTIDSVEKTDKDHDPLTIWYTGLFHALQYPNDYSEPFETIDGKKRIFYNGYKDTVEEDTDSYYQSWSLWDTYRAEHSLMTIFAPERVNSMMNSLLRIYKSSGRLPMWANLVETNIMIGTNADIVLANALSRGFSGFDIKMAWDAVWKDCDVPPDRDTELHYSDREGNTPYEVRAGLTTYKTLGWVADDRWSESASRTLNYALDDWAASVVAKYAGNEKAAAELLARSKNYAKIWNNDTEFMQARKQDGTWSSPNSGWTEGDFWVYTFDVMHDPEGLAALFKDGRAGMKKKLDHHFEGGHNRHANEPSHHVPYLYASIGYPADTARQVREIARQNYDATSAGLTGNEDCGQMSAWYIFSTLGFYPVNPASDEYVVGSPFFDKVTIRLPPGAATGGDVSKGGEEKTLVISAPGASKNPYVAGLSVNGVPVHKPLLKHSDIVNGGIIEFKMSDKPTPWGT